MNKDMKLDYSSILARANELYGCDNLADVPQDVANIVSHFHCFEEALVEAVNAAIHPKFISDIAKERGWEKNSLERAEQTLRSIGTSREWP